LGALIDSQSGDQAAATALAVPKLLSPPTQKASALAPADTGSGAEPHGSERHRAMHPDQRQAIAPLVRPDKELEIFLPRV
jgi:hypothetical protein